MKENTIRQDDLKYIDEDVYSQIKNYTISRDDLYLTIAGTIGNVGQVPDELDGMNLTENAAKLTHILIDKDFLMYQLMSSYSQEHFVSRFHQVAQPKLSIETASSTLLAIPPLSEQVRISQLIEQYLNLVAHLEDDLESIGGATRLAKSKILDLAITGKLVPQDPSDEPAIEALRRINPDFKPCDNPHYQKNLPTSWSWCKLGDIFTHNTGKALNRSNNIGKEYSYITTSNVYWDRFELDDLKTMYYADNEIDKCLVRKGDLLVCEGGDIGRAAVWDKDYVIMIQNHLHRLRPISDGISTSLYAKILWLYKRKGLIGGKGIAIQGLSSNALHKIEVPFPPIHEQYRIMKQIDLYFTLLDKIQSSLEA
jgi:type I restriction enzyme S subunit